MIEDYNKEGRGSGIIQNLKDFFSYLKGSFKKVEIYIRKITIELIAKPPPQIKSLLNKQLEPVGQENLAGLCEITPFISMKWGPQIIT